MSSPSLSTVTVETPNQEGVMEKIVWRDISVDDIEGVVIAIEDWIGDPDEGYTSVPVSGFEGS